MKGALMSRGPDGFVFLSRRVVVSVVEGWRLSLRWMARYVLPLLVTIATRSGPSLDFSLGERTTNDQSAMYPWNREDHRSSRRP